MNEDLTDYEKKVFDNLPKKADLNPALREKTVQKLKSDGMIRAVPVKRNGLRWAASVAASILLFISGLKIGQWSVIIEPVDDEINPALGYAILLYEDEQFIQGEPLARAEEYGDWMRSVSGQGYYIRGQELSDESSAINLPTTTEHVLRGYFLLEAHSLEEAIGLVETIPHVKYGGGVEVKKFVNR